jgi:hypothetical protein
MKKRLSIMVTVIIFSSIIISCNKGNHSKDSNETIVSDKNEDIKEDGASLRLKVLDSVLKIMKDESPYPNDMEVLSMKEVDSITNSEVAERSLRLSKGASVGSGYYVDPRITPELQKRALDKSILGYVLHYKIRFRVNDMRVDVKDCVIVIDAVDNSTIYSDDSLIDHELLVHQVMIKLENYLLNTIK